MSSMSVFCTPLELPEKAITAKVCPEVGTYVGLAIAALIIAQAFVSLVGGAKLSGAKYHIAS